MRRQDREVTNQADVLDILERCDTLRIAFQGEAYPYIVPVSFGFSVQQGQVCLYVHGALQGKRHDLLLQSNRVCVEADICHRFVRLEGDYTTQYESVIGFGCMEAIEGAEALAGLDCIMAHCGFAGEQVPAAALPRTSVHKITLHTLTGKRRAV